MPVTSSSTVARRRAIQIGFADGRDMAVGDLEGHAVQVPPVIVDHRE
jgi:hypothetical protein